MRSTLRSSFAPSPNLRPPRSNVEKWKHNVLYGRHVIKYHHAFEPVLRQIGSRLDHVFGEREVSCRRPVSAPTFVPAKKEARFFVTDNPVHDGRLFNPRSTFLEWGICPTVLFRRIYAQPRQVQGFACRGQDCKRVFVGGVRSVEENREIKESLQPLNFPAGQGPFLQGSPGNLKILPQIV